MAALAARPTVPRAQATGRIRPAVLFAMACLLACLLATGRAAAAVLTVHAGQSIGAAVAQARPGDEIRVERGLYRENLLIDKPLTLKGIDRPTLSGGMKGDTIRITAEDVTIDGLIVRDSGDSLVDQNAGIYIRPGANRAIVRNCDLTYNLFGLWIESVSNVQILNNVITGKRDYASVRRGNGIELYHTEGARIIGNNISFVRDGIYVDVSNHALFRNNRIHNSRYGTHYMNSNDNVWEGNDSYHNRGGLALMMARNQVVRNNRAWGNSDHGIMLRTLQDSVIEGNIVAGNNRGFFIYDAEYNTIRNNLVMDNTVGVHLWAGSYHNKAEGNDFILNRTQIKYVASRDEIWPGNYWSNYVGWDRNGDGIGDVPYEANDMVDYLSWRHPMMKLLLASPAVQTLRMVSQQFPLLRATSIVDPKPRMRPHNPDWRQWRGKYFPHPQ
jgi:nitrous oxidase accessory protein